MNTIASCLLVLVCFSSIGMACSVSGIKGCTLRSYLNEIQTENNVLSCKLNSIITSLSYVNSTPSPNNDLIRERTHQAKIISIAMDLLKDEIYMITQKCNNFNGENCDVVKTVTCFGKNDSNACNGHGQCILHDTCSCDKGYGNADCSVHMCNGTLSTDPSACSAHGQCVSVDTCSCEKGYGNADCSVHMCNGTLSTDPSVCSAHGQCVSVDNCSCEKGYGNADCSVHLCNGTLSTDPSVCSAHGKCVSVNTCSCDSGWTGTTCNVPLCNSIPSTDSSVCSGNGRCVNKDTCNCLTGYTNQWCSQIVVTKELVDNKYIAVDMRFPNGTAARTCKEYLLADQTLINGVYFIKPFVDDTQFKVFCDMKNGGYTLFQKRIDNGNDFYRPWNDYVVGFGDPKTSYWLGLRRIQKFTETYNCKLRIELYHASDGIYVYATYSSFSLGTEPNEFPLHVSGFSGNGGDSLALSNGYKFSTYDNDNDVFGGNCASQFHGAFWYKNCHHANLNGVYYMTTSTSESGISWYTYKNNRYSFFKPTMGMIEI